MKKLSRLILTLALTAAMILLVACTSSTPTFRFVNHTLDLEFNQTLELEILNEAKSKDVSYKITSVLDENDQTVSQDAYDSYLTLSAYTSKDSNIYATAGSKKGTVTVLAYLTNDETTSSTAVITISANKVNSMQISVENDSTSVQVGSTLQFTVACDPLTGNQAVNWSTSNSNIATIDENGLLTAKAVKVSDVSLANYQANGGALITVIATSTTDTSMEARKQILVTADSASSVEITGNTQEQYDENAKIQLTAKITPDSAYDYVSWSSSNTAKATVDANGLVTTYNLGGSVDITATTVDGVSATTSIFVEYMPTETLSFKPVSYSMVVGATYDLTNTALKLTPASANPNVTYDIVDPTICSIENGVITALKAGTTVIKATSVEGTLSAEFTLTVYNVPTAYTSIKLKDGTALNYGYYEDGSMWIVAPSAKTANIDFEVVTTPENANYNSVWSISSKKAITSFYATADGYGRATFAANATDTLTMTVTYRTDKTVTITLTIHVVSEAPTQA